MTANYDLLGMCATQDIITARLQGTQPPNVLAVDILLLDTKQQAACHWAYVPEYLSWHSYRILKLIHACASSCSRQSDTLAFVCVQLSCTLYKCY